MFQGLSKLCPVNPTIHVYVILLAIAMAKIVKSMPGNGHGRTWMAFDAASGTAMAVPDASGFG